MVIKKNRDSQKKLLIKIGNLNKLVPVSKHSQAAIIGTVLLILIVMVSAIAVMNFVVPFIQNQLEGTSCLEIVGKIEITNNLQYTCYNITSKKMSLQIHYGDIENLTQGFRVNVNSGGTSKTFEVIPGTLDKVTMLDGSAVSIPTKNGLKTYLLEEVNTFPESISVYPILKEEQNCGVSDSINSIGGCV